MSNPIDEETYGDRTVRDPNAVKQGNPGKPQSEYQVYDEPEDRQPQHEPSDFSGGAGEVVPGTTAPTEDDD
jgi:hypothetical protein